MRYTGHIKLDTIYCAQYNITKGIHTDIVNDQDMVKMEVTYEPFSRYDQNEKKHTYI